MQLPFVAGRWLGEGRGVVIPGVDRTMSGEGDGGAIRSEGVAQGGVSSLLPEGWTGFPVSARLGVPNHDVLGADVLWSEHRDVKGVVGVGVGVVELVDKGEMVEAELVGPDFDFGVSFTTTVAGVYTSRGGPRLSVRVMTLVVPTRGPLYLLSKPPHSRTRISVAPSRERLPGCNPNWVRVLKHKGGKW